MLPVPRSNTLLPKHCPDHGRLVRHGSFVRKDDSRIIRRWRCSGCRKTYSQATNDPCFRQHKRKVNSRLLFDLCSGMSQRRIARGLRVNRKTVVRKFIFFGSLAIEALDEFNSHFPRSTNIEFDEMEAYEHTKCKPLSIPIAVEFKTRRILGVRVCSMPCKGRLAKIAVKKYGRRRDDRKKTRLDLLKQLKTKVYSRAIIRSDMNPSYPSEIKEVFPFATHQAVKGKRGAVTGQGELKKQKYDRIFSLNHTAAMLRENTNRLRRKTWCTTKRPHRLLLHMNLYALFHNYSLNLI